ncbi:MAG TPA: glycoside-pentoside-hexuronide (GPH):cation symporter [Anaerolineae bacterium]|nr:glycoside-pentoside-hexuronide (GPH):cation symporter [Anaerolineae bacterium]HQH38386.1 glycoside-pentoside-hexuronide (GPH):cation symporter [Anaerolineae bacterium]
MDTPLKKQELPWITKVIYGTGDWGMATFNTLRQVFYAIFLTDVVGLEPRLASFAAFFGVLWDAINDPLVGVISDKAHTRWGRRRPFLLFFAVPYGLAFLILWWAPPWKSQIMLMIHMMLTYALSDTFQTFVIVPYHALTPEITSDYDERTSLASYRMFFNLIASIAAAVAAPMIVDATLSRGGTQQQGYMIAAALFGASAVIPYLLIFFSVREKSNSERPAETVSFKATLRMAWQNIPFRYATALYMLNWVTFDLISVALPYFLIYWIAQGNLLATVPWIGMPVESVALGAMLLTAVIVLPFWTWLARHLGKHKAYIIAIGFWVILLLLINFIPPLDYTAVVVMAVLIGVSVSAAHVLPDAIFPDVIDWDELRTGQRHEGIYYGVKNFIRKLTTAFAIFMALQALGWLGYQVPPAGVTQFTQPESAILGIRILTGPLGALLLIGVMIVAWFYPLDRQRYDRVRRLLARRQQREARRLSGAAVMPSMPQQ